MPLTPTFRVLFLGARNDASAGLLRGLLDAGVDVCGVLVAADRPDGPPIAQIAPARAPGSIPIANPFIERTVAQIAWERGLPVFELRRPGAPDALALIAALKPDVGSVACFPLRLPAPLLALARLGFLNMHPALLPFHRGPAPLFWMFRSGERTGGATIHFMDQGLDTGDIVAQEAFDLADGISGVAAERHCNAIGVRLMIAALRDLRAGALARWPQPPGGGYEAWPGPDDWRIETSWPARRAFNFMRGTAEWGQPYIVGAGGQEIALAGAIAYDPDATLAEAFVDAGDQLRIAFSPGLLRARRA
jgi:methionyl-tRNA formyltransferase